MIDVTNNLIKLSSLSSLTLFTGSDQLLCSTFYIFHKFLSTISCLLLSRSTSFQIPFVLLLSSFLQEVTGLIMSYVFSFSDYIFQQVRYYFHIFCYTIITISSANAINCPPLTLKLDICFPEHYLHLPSTPNYISASMSLLLLIESKVCWKSTSSISAFTSCECVFHYLFIIVISIYCASLYKIALLSDYVSRALVSHS